MDIKAYLTADHFAMNAGCVIEEAREGYARVTMRVEERHLNAGGVCQGGALFTLADLALAAVMNIGGQLTFGIENNIVFLKSGRLGDVLTAEATEVNAHHKLPYIDVRITNQQGELCAVVTGLGYRVKVKNEE